MPITSNRWRREARAAQFGELIMSLVTVSRAFNPAAAQLTRAQLEAAGFHPVVMHELSALSMDGYALAAGGILVQVPESEAADAKELLEATPPAEEEGSDST